MRAEPGSWRLAVSALCAAVVLSGRARGADVLVEAEQFADYGGWVLDPQFLAAMGSPYLLAHGLGRPVANARTQLTLPATGTYTLWVRTRDWVPGHSPGRFRVLVDGKAIGPVFGTAGGDWAWQEGGALAVETPAVTVELQDLTGFDGRCDALFFTDDHDFEPPPSAGEDLRIWRRRLLGLPETPPPAGELDVVVVGGGIAGCAAALSAARLGCRVALVQNRPVLGGNASSEIGLTARGQRSSVVDQLVRRNAEGVIQARAVLEAEEEVTLFLGWHAFAAVKDGDRIAGIDAVHTSTARELRFRAPVFIDCSGVAAVGSLAGADVRFGREAKAELGESLAPEKPDRMHHGNTVTFRTRISEQPPPFPSVSWATAVSKGYADLGGQVLRPGQDNRPGPFSGQRSKGSGLTHFWEYGQWLDPYADGEHIRDHLLRAVYGSFATVKANHPRASANLALDYVAYVPAGGELRRLMGDHILTENDIREQRAFPDAVAVNAGHFCLHFPGGSHDFRLGDWKWVPVKPYQVPFRCLYSRNVVNLMMAGKHISVTHVAGSSTKTMLNGGQHGVAVGSAAFLCKKHKTTPRGVWVNHIGELQDILAGRGQYRGALTR